MSVTAPLQTATQFTPLTRTTTGLQHLLEQLCAGSEFLSASDLPCSEMEALREETVAALHPYYDELALGFAQSHIPCGGQVLASPGFSSVAKLGLTVMIGEQYVGVCVLTVKRSRSLKLGPLYLRPEWRTHHLGRTVLLSLAERAVALGYSNLYATVPHTNYAAIRAITEAGFHHLGSLESHYKPGVNEILFSSSAWPTPSEPGQSVLPLAFSGTAGFVQRHFFDVDRAWQDWSRVEAVAPGEHRAKPKRTIGVGDAEALMVYKRGRTVKVIPAVGDDHPLRQPLIEEWESHCVQQRKISVLCPKSERFAAPLLASGYQVEAALPQGHCSLHHAVQIWAKLGR